ncbi:MAG: hypothetical protein LBN36_05235 [Clostridiales Family XIII bacterium]|jgi:hypothetical protein|nr:hypothetical protein [Clostridiales Family XIII bacterium]
MKEKTRIFIVLLMIILLVGTAACSKPMIPSEPPIEEADDSDPENYYVPILDQFKTAVESGFSDQDYSTTDLALLLQDFIHTSWDQYGDAFVVEYAYRDLDGNGVPELFIGHPIPSEDDSVWFIYTLHGNEPILMPDFWSRGRYLIDDSDVITRSYSSGGVYGRIYYKIASDGYSFERFEGISAVRYEPGQEKYYHRVDGDETEISKDEFIEIAAKYPNWDSNSGLEWKQLASYKR